MLKRQRRNSKTMPPRQRPRLIRKLPQRRRQPAPTPAEPPKKVGGRQTQGLGGGYYAAIIGARRHVMNVVDSIAWIQGVRSFKAEEGRKPKDND